MEEDKKPTVLGRIIKWIFRLTIVAICLLLFFIGSLHLLQDTGEPQQKGLSSAFSQMTGLDVDIGNLKEFELFPYLKLDLGNISLIDPVSKDLKGNVESFEFEGPGSVVFSKKNAFNEMTIRNAKLFENGFPAFKLDKGDIVFDENTKAAQFIGQGFLNERAFTVEVPLQASALDRSTQKRIYLLKDNIPFHFKMGGVDLKGNLTSDDNGFLTKISGTLGGQKLKCIVGRPLIGWLNVQVKNAVMMTSDNQFQTVEMSLTPQNGVVLRVINENIKISETPYSDILKSNSCF